VTSTAPQGSSANLLGCSCRGLIDTVTGQLADATGEFACLVFVLLAASARPRVVQSASWRTASCPVTIDTVIDQRRGLSLLTVRGNRTLRTQDTSAPRHFGTSARTLRHYSRTPLRQCTCELTAERYEVRNSTNTGRRFRPRRVSLNFIFSRATLCIAWLIAGLCMYAMYAGVMASLRGSIDVC